MLKTCWRCLQDMSWTRLEDIFKTNKCLLGSNNKNIIENLDNKPLSNYNINDYTGYTNKENCTSMSNNKSNSNAYSATNNNNGNHNTLDPNFKPNNQSRYEYNKSYYFICSLTSY